MKPIGIPKILCCSLLIVMRGLPSFSEILPPERIFDWSRAGIPGGIPDYPVQHSVLDFGAAGDGVTDDTNAFRAAINATTPGYALYVLEGTFLVTGTLTIRKGVVVRGAGPSKTLIHSKHNGNAFWLWGNAIVEMTTLATASGKGSRTIQVASAQGISAGDLLRLKRQDNALLLVEVEQVDGNQITLSDALHSDLNVGIPVSRFNDLVEGAGVEAMKIFIEPLEGDVCILASKVKIEGVARCWVRNIETKGCSYEVSLHACYQCEARDSFFHNPFEEIIARGSGFGSYGVELNNGTSLALVENNVFRNFRHAIPMSNVVEGNVFGYNMSAGMWDGVPIARSSIIGDMEFHHNHVETTLVEGNNIEYIRFNGAAGYLKNWNVVLRNRTTLTGIAGWSDTGINYIVGNELPPVKIELNGATNSIGSTSMAASLVHGNYVSYEDEGLSWDPAVSDHTIPDSYYLSEKPVWFGDLAWPPYGGDLMEAGGGFNPNRIPAEVRYWTRRFPESAPTGLTAERVDATTVELNWTSQSTTGGHVDKIDFIVARSLDGVHFERLGITEQTTYTDADLMPGQHYWYYVRARNNVSVIEDGTDQIWSGPGGESDPSNVI